MPATPPSNERFHVHVADRMIDGRLWRPDDGAAAPPPAVLWCGDTVHEDVVRLLNATGIAVATYDGGGRSGPGTVDDASAVFRWLSLSGEFDIDRIGLLGCADGAPVAAGLAGRSDRIAALCLLVPLVDDRDGDAMDAAGMYDRPTLVLEGAADRTATPGVAAAWADRLRADAHRVEHLIVARGDHELGPPEARHAWMEPLERFFGSMAPAGQPAGGVEQARGMAALPDYDDALAQALAGLEPTGRREDVDLERAAGRVLTVDLVADRDLPPFDRAQMDGYALRSAEVSPGRGWPVVATVPAGAPGDVDVPDGACVAIATGAPVPPGLDTVIQHELSDRADPVHFTVDSMDAGHAVHPRGADATAGDVVLPAGTHLRGHHLGIAASVGRTRLPVTARPRAVVLTSGDEIVPPDTTPLPHQVRNSNATIVRWLLERTGAEAFAVRHLPDERAETIDAVGAALADADIVVTVGGVSAGQRDHFPEAFETHGMAPSLSGAAIQPGRPIRVARHPAGAVIVALPGNPVSVLACGCLFLWPIVRRLSGLDAALPWRTTPLAAPVRPNPRRRAFRPAAIVDGGARVPEWAGSGDLVHTAMTDGLAELPVQDGEVSAGTVVRFLAWP